MPARPVGITRAGAELRLPAAALARMRREFRERRFVPLPRLLRGPLLEEALARLAAAAWAPAGLERERYINYLRPADPAINLRLSFLLNDPALFDAVRSITGCRPIKGFLGRVIRHDPGEEHFLDWHSDYHAGGPDRLVALRVNLSPKPFKGGHLLFRDRRGRELPDAFRSGAPGDAVLFSAARDSYHRNSPVLGSVPKIAFSGWFYAVKRDGGTTRIPGRAIYASRNFALGREDGPAR